jgi:3' terminal RNA ribose 2'-O-methyltransferase Hen1
VKLQELLRHIYVLIPVFDYRKHYWIGNEEVDKLLAHGSGWLENHPEKNFITRRYFSKLGHFTRQALERLNRLDNGEGGAENPAIEEDQETEAAIPIKAPRINDQRLHAVLGELKVSGAKSVIDIGCGEGNLLRLLIKEKDITSIAGTDVSATVLNRAAERLGLDRLGEKQKTRVALFQSSLFYRDKRFKNYDAAAIVEVIEHLEQNRLSSFASVVFGDAAFSIVIITTPTADYNVNYPWLASGNFRHGDHRFEWNRSQFHAWADVVAARYGYTVRYEDIGEQDEKQRTPSQMAVFKKNAAQKTIPSEWNAAIEAVP